MTLSRRKFLAGLAAVVPASVAAKAIGKVPEKQEPDTKYHEGFMNEILMVRASPKDNMSNSVTITRDDGSRAFYQPTFPTYAIRSDIQCMIEQGHDVIVLNDTDLGKKWLREVRIRGEKS